MNVDRIHAYILDTMKIIGKSEMATARKTDCIQNLKRVAEMVAGGANEQHKTTSGRI